jgi:flavin reductase (DIM6/NTAB) family NADH-FMN oxidoreductase RutF
MNNGITKINARSMIEMKKISYPASNNFCPNTLFLFGTYKEDGKPNYGLFSWFSYCWDGEFRVMACIGEDKLTRDRIRETKIFSASLVSESIHDFQSRLSRRQ